MKAQLLTKNSERKIKSFCEKYKVESDLIDYSSLWDNSLTEGENLSFIERYVEDLSLNRLERKGNSKAIKTEKEEQERLNLNNLKKEEEYTEQEFIKTLEEYKKSNESVIKEYDIPREYIKSIVKGFNKAFVFIGGAGLGKTFLTRQVLVKEKCRFVENRGVNSPMALYQFLYNNNEEDLILVFDDTAGLINNPSAYSILLNVLWEGFAEWNSTTERLKAPKKFQFKGKIIFITNKLNSDNAEILKSRCLVYDLKLKNKDIIKMMSIIANQEHKRLTKEERLKIVDFIKENSNESIRVDLRTQQKIEQLYLYDKLNWEKLSIPLLEKDNEMELLMSCLSSANTITEAQQNWCIQTGSSRRKFYYLKREIYDK